MLPLVSAVLYCCFTGTHRLEGGDCSVKDSQQTLWLYYLASSSSLLTVRAVTIFSVFMFVFWEDVPKCTICWQFKVFEHYTRYRIFALQQCNFIVTTLKVNSKTVWTSFTFCLCTVFAFSLRSFCLVFLKVFVLSFELFVLSLRSFCLVF